MGYIITVLRSEWRIAASDLDRAYSALRELIGHETINKKLLPNLTGADHFSFVDQKDFETAPDLASALRAWRWETIEDEDGSLIEIDLADGDRKLGDEVILFSALAPFVEDGSFIDIFGRDDGAIWRWQFSDGELHRRDGSVVFDEPRLAKSGEGS